MYFIPWSLGGSIDVVVSPRPLHEALLQANLEQFTTKQSKQSADNIYYVNYGEEI